MDERPESGADGEAPGAAGRERNPVVGFVLLFTAYLIVIAVAYPEIRERFAGSIDRIASATAYLESAFLGLFSDQVRHEDKLVVFAGFPVKIIEECTGVYELLIYAAAVLAFPTSWSKRGLGLLLGAPILYAFNVLRILALILTGAWLPQVFEFMHLYFWQATLVLMVGAVWLLWFFLVVQRGTAEGGASGDTGGEGSAGGAPA